jgi:RNA polymerase sigma-70 factor, ECF subfamily
MSSDEINKDKALELLERIKNKDQRAMTQFHRLFSQRIYAFALNRLGNAADAEAVVSQTMFVVWQKPDSFNRKSKLITWLTGIAKNKARDFCGEYEKYENEDDIDNYSEILESASLSPEDSLAKKQEVEKTKDCLDKLPPAQKECLSHFYGDEWPIKKIAERLKVPEGTVKTRLHHARENLKKCLQGSSK